MAAAAARAPKLQRGTAARLAKPGEEPAASLLASCGWAFDELAPSGVELAELTGDVVAP